MDDHCRGIQLVLEQGERGGIYHINGDVELTNRELTAAILEACDAGWDMVTMVEDRKGHDRRYSLDDSVLRAAGYLPRIPFADGLRSTVQWYVDNRDWWEPLKRADQAESAHRCPVDRAFRARRRTGRVSGWLVTGPGECSAGTWSCFLSVRARTGWCATVNSISPMRPRSAPLCASQPAVVVNCAAWTAVDDAETHEDAALQVNGHAVADLAAACADHGITLVQVSTDYVFDGTSAAVRRGNAPSPRTAYGRSKLAGEQAVLDLLARRFGLCRTDGLAVRCARAELRAHDDRA